MLSPSQVRRTLRAQTFAGRMLLRRQLGLIYTNGPRKTLRTGHDGQVYTRGTATESDGASSALNGMLDPCGAWRQQLRCGQWYAQRHYRMLSSQDN